MKNFSELLTLKKLESVNIDWFQKELFTEVKRL